jgi:hypothetical protein
MKELLQILLSELSRYLISLFGLLSGPKSFVRTLNEDNKESLVAGFTFLGVSFALYSLLQAPLLPPDVDFLRWTLSQAVPTLIAFIAGLGLLQVSWRIVGGKAPFNRQLITYAYFAGVGVLIFVGAGTLIALGIMKLFYPGVFELMTASIGMKKGAYDAFSEKMNAMFAGDRAGWLMIAALNGFPFVAGWIWIFIGWGAYRELNLVSKWASAAAFIVHFVLSLAILPLLIFMALSMMSS